MKSLTEDQIQVVFNALVHYATEQENVISQNYLELDKEEIVSESERILGVIDSLMSLFINKKKIHLMSEWDKKTLENAFNRSDEIYTSEDNYVLKSGMFLGLIDGIKAIIHNKH